MESWVQATGSTFKGLSILLERFYGVASQHGQAMQARLRLSIEHAHSMRDPKEALTVAIDRSGVGSGQELIKTEEQKASQLEATKTAAETAKRVGYPIPQKRGALGRREVSAGRRS
jgi:hypothetical protein